MTGLAVSLAPIARATTTDTVGSFSFERVDAGLYTLIVTGPAVDTLSTRIVVLDGQTTRLLLIAVARGVDTAAPTQLPPVVVRASKPRAASPLPEVRGTATYAGQRTEVVALDSLTVDAAEDKSRDVLGRVPGVNIAETANSGFPSNGIGVRGLNPTQSVEMNVRQDGINIVADLYGYPETYYTPPTEALERVEVVRGSASLQFGPQFGGVIDYILRSGQPNTPPTVVTNETGGSFGLFDSYASVGGGVGRWTYFAYAQYRGDGGWRPNADVTQVAAAGRIGYQATPHLRLGFEYSLLRNRIHMPGGLTDSVFAADPAQSFRARNWLASPWNILAGSLEAELGANTHLTSSLSYMFSQRYLVWRNEDGGPGAVDSVDPMTQTYTPREVEREYFTNVTDETRLRSDYHWLGGVQTFITGVRLFSGVMHRQEGGVGTTGSDFDMSLVAPYGTDLQFGSANVAGFAENILRVGHLAIVPGVRVEFLRSTAAGYADDSAFAPNAKNRTFALAGLGAQFALPTTTIYGNVTQAYRPIEYSYLYPIGSTTRVDPNLHDPTGFNADLGWRGELGPAISFDVGAFYLWYHNRIDVVSVVDSSGAAYTESENTGTSVHQGVETYLSVRPLAWLHTGPAWGLLELWESLGYTHARYTSGPFVGNTVEYAPALVSRLGVTYTRRRATVAATWSVVTQQYTDANNTVFSPEGEVGVIPTYELVDASAEVRLGERGALEAGVTNLGNVAYFTTRTTEYPGPGIIPGIGRGGYLTLRLNL